MKQFNLFIPLSKVDEAQRLVYGLATAETVDKSGEIFDYESSLPYYKEWSGDIQKASGGKSLGNVREMHTNIAAGKLTQIEFNDEKKQIEVCAKIVDDSTWGKVMEGVLTGFSHGGEYIKTWKDPDNAKLTRYTARPAELSVVDNPCLGAATFELVRADGATEMRKFKNQEKPMETVIEGKPAQPKYKPIQKWEASDGETFEKKDDWRAYELTLETAAVTAPALNALAELEKAVSEKEIEADALSNDEQKKVEKVTEKMTLNLDSLVTKARQAAVDIKKGFSEAYDAKTAIEALCIIECLISGEEWESMMGEGEEGQIADLKEAVSRIKAFIAAEIMEGEAEKSETAGDLGKAGARHSAADKGQLAKAKASVDEAADHLDDAKKHHGTVTKSHDGMRKTIGSMADCMKALKAGDLSKLDAEALEKYRKEASEGTGKLSGHMDDMETHLDKADKHHGKLGKAHDGIEAAQDAAHHALKAVGASDGEGEAEKISAAEMKKQAEVDDLAKAENDALKLQNETLQKALDKVNAEVPAMIQPLIERLKKLEAQPAQAKGAVFAVEKGHEAKPADKPVEAPSYSTYGASPAEMREVMNINP